MDHRVGLGKRIREVRRKRSLSQGKLAERMGANTAYISSVERGRENPTLEFLGRLAEALHVEIGDFFNFAWSELTEAELRQQLRAIVDRATPRELVEMLALLRTRSL